MRLARWGSIGSDELKDKILCDEGRKRKVQVAVLDGFLRLGALYRNYLEDRQSNMANFDPPGCALL
jgi:hypothetical protein